MKEFNKQYDTWHSTNKETKKSFLTGTKKQFLRLNKILFGFQTAFIQTLARKHRNTFQGRKVLSLNHVKKMIRKNAH